MAGSSLLDRFRRRPAEAPPESAAQATPAIQRRLPAPGTLRRERRALVRAREERIRDLGGLMLEMYRRDRFREDLVQERCVEVIAIDDRLSEVDGLLKAVAELRSPRTAPRCS